MQVSFSTFVSSMLVNLNQYRGTVGVFNNRNIAFCNFYDIRYSQSFRNCIILFFLILFSAYLFIPLECLKSSFLSLLRVTFRTIHTSLSLILCIRILLLYTNHFWLYKIALKFSGDIEESTGPKPSSNQRFFICHWNLNSISAHNYINIFLLITYTFTHKFDVICFHETYLESDTSDDNDNLKTAGYNSV